MQAHKLYKIHEDDNCSKFLDIIRYLYAVHSVDVRPQLIYESSFPPEITTVPTIVMKDGTKFTGLTRIVNFYESNINVYNLLARATEFTQKNPDYRITDKSTHRRIDFSTSIANSIAAFSVPGPQRQKQIDAKIMKKLPVKHAVEKAIRVPVIGASVPITRTVAPVPITRTVAPVPITRTVAPVPITRTVTSTVAPVPITRTMIPVPMTSTVTSTATPVPMTSTVTPVPMTSTVTSTVTPVPVTSIVTPVPVTSTMASKSAPKKATNKKVPTISFTPTVHVPVTFVQKPKPEPSLPKSEILFGPMEPKPITISEKAFTPIKEEEPIPIPNTPIIFNPTDSKSLRLITNKKPIAVPRRNLPLSPVSFISPSQKPARIVHPVPIVPVLLPIGDYTYAKSYKF